MTRAHFLMFFSLVLLFATAFNVSADESAHLDRVGQVYPVVEPDFVEEAKQRAAQVDWEKAIDKKKMEKKIKNFRPQNMTQLPTATRPRTRFVDMTYTLDRDILNGKGEILYPKGFQYNPLDYLPPGINIPTLIVINGDDPLQLEWLESSALKNDSNVKILLSGGNFYEVSERLGFHVYYLMNPVTQRLSLERVPCVVRKVGNMMYVEEFVITSEKG